MITTPARSVRVDPEMLGAGSRIYLKLYIAFESRKLARDFERYLKSGLTATCP